MGYRLVRITFDILEALLRYDGIARQETLTFSGLPEDAVIVDVDASDACLYGRVTLKMQSKEWAKPSSYPGHVIETISINIQTFRYGLSSEAKGVRPGEITH